MVSSAAASALGDEERDELSSLLVALSAAVVMVQRRGQAAQGEKTFLDALIPALQAARQATSLTEALPLMRLAAIAGTEETMSALPKHGRARVGRRAGHRAYPTPGAWLRSGRSRRWKSQV